jgi:hypothetical protein
MDKEGPILLSQLEHDRAYDRNRAGVKDGVALPLAPFAVGALAGPENCANSAAMPPHGGSINIRQTTARCMLSNVIALRTASSIECRATAFPIA